MFESVCALTLTYKYIHTKQYVVGHMRSNTPLTAPGHALWRKVSAYPSDTYTPGCMDVWMMWCHTLHVHPHPSQHSTSLFSFFSPLPHSLI